MGNYEKKHGDWILFYNDRKPNEKSPDYRGDIMLDGVVYELSGWEKTTKGGATFLAGSMRPKQERRGGRETPEDAF